MFNLLSLFQTIDKGRQIPYLAAMSPQIAGQPVQAVDGAPLVQPTLTPDAEVLELMNRSAAQPIAPQPMTASQAANLQVQPLAQQPAATVPQEATMPAPVLSRSQELRARQQEIQDPNRYKEGGAGRNKKWSTLEKVASAGMGALIGFSKGGVGGAVVGALQGGNRNYQQQLSDQRVLAGLAPQIKSAQENEQFDTAQLMRQSQIGELQRKPEKEAADRQARIQLKQDEIKARVESETQKFNNRLKVLDIQAKNDGNKWQPYVDKDGKLWKQYRNDPSKQLEPITNPQGDQEVNPGEQYYDTISPITGQPVKLKGNQLYSGESNVAAGNASRAQQADTTNVNNEQEYEKSVVEIDRKRVELANEGNGKINQSYELENQAKAAEQQAANRASALEAEAQKFEDAGDSAKASQNRLKAASVKDEAGKLKIQASKLREEGNAALNKAQNLKYPAKPSAVKAQTVGGKYAGQYFPSPKALKSAFPNKSEAEIRRIIEANGGKFQN